MTEKQLRQKVVDTAKSFLGRKESDGSHKKIIDIYNNHKPLARGYKVKYTDAWCSTYASAVAITCGLTNIIPTECGCEEHIKLFKNIGSWQENDAYVPSPGDYIFYDWQDTGVGDNTGRADHIGIVVSVKGTVITIIEGNINNAVGYRDFQVNQKCIRGYGVPKYSTITSKPVVSTPAPSSLPNVGDIVNFTGSTHYISTNATNGAPCKPGKAKVTAVYSTGKHAVHLVAVKGGASNVYGWVDVAQIARENANLAVGAKVKVNKGAKTYEGKSLAFFVYGLTYNVISIQGDRVVIGVGKVVTAAINKKDLTVV